jgi:hypothetical protein
VPISYYVDADGLTINIVVSGAVTYEDVSAHVARLTSDPAVTPAMGQLIDARDIGDPPPTPEIHRMAQIYAGLQDSWPARYAVVVSTDLMFGVARMFQGLAAFLPGTFEVFRDAGEARRWLSLGG